MPVPVEQTFEDAVEQSWPAAEWRDVHVVVAVSGGPDSVALLRALLAIKSRVGGMGDIRVAHLNHGLRGDAADADQAWVESLGRHFSVRLETARVDVSRLATEQGDGWEAAARSARYDFFCETAQRLGARFVAVGHTADDQVETVLHRFLRGTGIAGLAGMPFTRPVSETVALVRPLLNVRRREVLQYLEALGQDFCRDATNDDRRFTRNRLRHDLLPSLRADFSGDVDQALLSLAQQAGQWQDVIGTLATELADRCVTIEWGGDSESDLAAEVHIDAHPLAAQAAIVRGEVCKTAWTRAGWPLQAMGFEEWQDLAHMVADTDHPPLNLPGNIRALRQDSLLILQRID